MTYYTAAGEGERASARRERERVVTYEQAMRSKQSNSSNSSAGCTIYRVVHSNRSLTGRDEARQEGKKGAGCLSASFYILTRRLLGHFDHAQLQQLLLPYTLHPLNFSRPTRSRSLPLLSRPLPSAIPLTLCSTVAAQRPMSTTKPKPIPPPRHGATPAEQQAYALAKLLANPDKPVHIPPPPAEGVKQLRAPREMMKNVQGSSAGAGSGEFVSNTRSPRARVLLYCTALYAVQAEDGRADSSPPPAAASPSPSSWPLPSCRLRLRTRSPQSHSHSTSTSNPDGGSTSD